MTAILENPRPVECRVRVWFGAHVIADYTSEPAKATDYHAGMTRRFPGLRVTIEPIATMVDDNASDL